jgi:16S rRNA processing protein RimM
MRPHGVRGDLSVKMMSDFPERINDLDVVYFGSDPENPRNLTKQHVTWVRRAKNDQWLLHLEGIDSRDDADAMRSKYIFVPLKDAVPLEANEVYLFQIIGLEVQTTQGEVLGRLVDVIETGANDVYVVQNEKYGEVLLPAIPSVILNINVEAGTMTVELPEGLLSD